ncbi:MAG: (2Fe-2S) ferredoxin domain-containing protein [Chloroflexi bacterium]|nr:(2Fe-2S) ferredoxin domain-containing protein [Chloroflexota bacterium]
MAEPPQMSPYERHIFICTGRFCDPEGHAAALYNRLPALLGELGNYENPCRVKRGTTPCLGVCAGGPILVVYPDGVWYHHVDEALLKQIVEEHLKENRPVVEAIFHRLGE